MIGVRFWSKVNKAGPVPEHRPDLGPCWHWIGSKFKGGYGAFWLDKRNRSAHQVAYELLVGEIPIGLEPDHLCRTRQCVNPNHLELVTPRENNLRGNGAAARNARKTSCLHGHPFEGENLVLPKRGGRDCGECHRKRNREYYTRTNGERKESK